MADATAAKVIAALRTRSDALLAGAQHLYDSEITAGDLAMVPVMRELAGEFSALAREIEGLADGK